MKGGGRTQSPPLQTAIDTEQLRNEHDSKRHVSGTKKKVLDLGYLELGVESSGVLLFVLQLSPTG